MFIHLLENYIYFLRIVLNHVKGAESFDHLKIIDGIFQPTYALGNLQSARPSWRWQRMDGSFTRSHFLRFIFTIKTTFGQHHPLLWSCWSKVIIFNILALYIRRYYCKIKIFIPNSKSTVILRWDPKLYALWVRAVVQSFSYISL